MSEIPETHYGVQISVTLSGELAEYAAPIWAALASQYPTDADNNGASIVVHIGRGVGLMDGDAHIPCLLKVDPEFEEQDAYENVRREREVVSMLLLKVLPDGTDLYSYSD